MADEMNGEREPTGWYDGITEKHFDRAVEKAVIRARASLAANAGGEPVAWVDERVIGWLANSRANSATIGTTLEKGKSLERLMPLYTHTSPPEGAGWTSVEERLPGEQGQDSEQVLVFINGHCELTDMECRQGGAWGLRLGYYDAERHAFRVHGRPEPHVTHWRPEPPAPPIPASEAKGAT